MSEVLVARRGGNMPYPSSAAVQHEWQNFEMLRFEYTRGFNGSPTIEANRVGSVTVRAYLYGDTSRRFHFGKTFVGTSSNSSLTTNPGDITNLKITHTDNTVLYDFDIERGHVTAEFRFKNIFTATW